ncbi:MAG: bifunctional ornithine acetyltransferase/N-acetylglutamate synthase, partial [Chloroflexota bacterium]|nr:bifunctional ornithine acetyltransferase/N-acetylglutamate synthase [Chloroflexota bacterium]
MDWRIIENGSLTSVRGIAAGAVKCGLKETGNPDLVLALWDRPANVAGMFTANRVKAAPVLLCQERLAARGNGYRAVVINAGNANACNGPQGLEDAREMARLVAQAAGLEEGSVLVMSTGVIGRKLPMEKLQAGIPRAVVAVSPTGGHDLARAIMTTDTVP